MIFLWGKLKIKEENNYIKEEMIKSFKIRFTVEIKSREKRQLNDRCEWRYSM
jgi:hypothetical protein